jgi:hypothetical protein
MESEAGYNRSMSTKNKGLCRVKHDIAAVYQLYPASLYIALYF